MGVYEFDKSSFSFKKASRSVGNVLASAGKFIFVTIVLALVYYVVFASLISTDTERRLRRENKMYEKLYPQMLEREKMLSGAISGLQMKDNEIYEDIFNSAAPSANPAGSLNFTFGSDTIPDRKLVRYTSAKAEDLLRRAEAVEATLLRVFSNAGTSVLPPLSLPLNNISYAQVGASLGRKVNPFYKVSTMHNGLDMIAPQGDPVFAAADGVVQNVVRSRKLLGNVVEISHEGGYVTRYCHLADIPVRKGQMVKKGRCIGYVGLSGNSFAPHLHYEILKDGEYVDPINYLFASVRPEEYMNMIIMSGTTGQSMD